MVVRGEAGVGKTALLDYLADQKALLCLVDDHQWVDQASGEVLAFIARRLAAESIDLILAARVPGKVLAGLRELAVRGGCARPIRAHCWRPPCMRR